MDRKQQQTSVLYGKHRPASSVISLGGAGHRGGFTLAEVLVAAFLLVLTLGLAAEVLIPTAVLFQVQSTRSNIQQGPLEVIHYLQRGVLNAQAETLTMLDTKPLASHGFGYGYIEAVSFVQIIDADPFDAVTGAPRLRSHFDIVWYDSTEQKILTKQWPPTPPLLTVYDFTDPARPPVLSRGDLEQIISSQNGTERVLTKNVESARFVDSSGTPLQYAVNWEDNATPPADGALFFPLRFSVTCAQAAARPRSSDQEMERFTMSTAVSPRSVRWQ